MNRSRSLVCVLGSAFILSLFTARCRRAARRRRPPKPRPRPPRAADDRRRAGRHGLDRHHRILARDFRHPRAAQPRRRQAEAAGHARARAGRHRRSRCATGQTSPRSIAARSTRRSTPSVAAVDRRQGGARNRRSRRSPTPCSSTIARKNLFEKGALPRQRLDAAETAHRSAVGAARPGHGQPGAGRGRAAPRARSAARRHPHLAGRPASSSSATTTRARCPATSRSSSSPTCA